MAISVITPEDFKGFYKLALNEFKEEDLNIYIEQFTQVYLRQILGSAAYSKITTEDFQKWLDVWNGVDFIDENGNAVHLTSLKKVILGFIYFEYVRDNFTSTTVGKVKGKSENSERSTDIEVANLARSRYNWLLSDFNESFCKLLKAYESIEEEVLESYELGGNTYLVDFLEAKYLNSGLAIEINEIEYVVSEVKTFTIDAGATGLDFTGQTASWQFQESVNAYEDNSDNTYNLLVDSTEALSTGDTVTINGTDYVATNVIENTCFTIDAGATGLDFTGQTASWTFDTTVATSTDLTDNTYLLTVVDSSYVTLGSSVSLDGTPYTLIDVDDMYSFDAGATGLDFTGQTASWHPFESVDFKEIRISGI